MLGDFRRDFRDMKNSHNPDLVILTKTRLSGDRASSIISNLGFEGFFKVDAMGFSRGIWVLWNPHKTFVDFISSSFHEILLTVKVNNKTSLLTALYGSTYFAVRKNIWLNLSRFSETINLPWLIMGDFNEIA